MKLAFVAVVIAVLASPCIAQTPAGEIENAKQQFIKGLNDGDAAAVARMYTHSAFVLPPNAEMIEGREAIEKYWRRVFGIGLSHVSAGAARVAVFGNDAAREIGRFRVDAAEPQDVLEGKYVILWRKMAKNWFLDSVIWNFSQGTGTVQ